MTPAESTAVQRILEMAWWFAGTTHGVLVGAMPDGDPRRGPMMAEAERQTSELEAVTLALHEAAGTTEPDVPNPGFCVVDAVMRAVMSGALSHPLPTTEGQTMTGCDFAVAQAYALGNVLAAEISTLRARLAIARMRVAVPSPGGDL